MTLVIWLFLLGFGINTSRGQTRAWTIQPSFGFTFRSTAMHFFNFKYIIADDLTIPYKYERNITGLSLTPGIQLEKGLASIQYSTNLRYDVVHGTIGKENVYVKYFLLDHNFGIARRVGRASVGIGYSIVNDNKAFTFVNPVLRRQNIEFNTVNFITSFPVKKIYTEIAVYYMPNGMPNHSGKYISYGLKMFYRFKKLSLQKKSNKGS